MAKDAGRFPRAAILRRVRPSGMQFARVAICDTREDEHRARQVLRVRGWWRGRWCGGYVAGGMSGRRSAPSHRLCACDSRPAFLRPLPCGRGRTACVRWRVLRRSLGIGPKNVQPRCIAFGTRWVLRYRINCVRAAFRAG